MKLKTTKVNSQTKVTKSINEKMTISQCNIPYFTWGMGVNSHFVFLFKNVIDPTCIMGRLEWHATILIHFTWLLTWMHGTKPNTFYWVVGSIDTPFFLTRWLFAHLPHIKCIRLGSVRSNRLPFKMHYVCSSLHICADERIASTFFKYKKITLLLLQKA